MFLLIIFISFSFCINLQDPFLLFSVEGQSWSSADFYEQVFKEDWEALSVDKKRSVFEDFVAQELVVFFATKKGFQNTPEVKKILDLRKRALLINNTYEHLIARPLINPDLFAISEQNLQYKVEAYHLLVGFSGSDTDTGSLISKERAFLLADSLRTEINKEASLGVEIDFALEYSKDPSVTTNKGFLGWLPWGHAVSSFQKPLFELEKKVVSNPILTQYGYHLALKTDVVFSNYYYYTPKHYIDLAYKVSQNTLPFDSLKVLSSAFDSLLIKNSLLKFNNTALDHLVLFLEKKQVEEKMLGNKNTLISWLKGFTGGEVLFLSNKKGFGRLWLTNKLQQTPSSRVPSIKTKEDLKNLILSFVLQEEVLLLGEEENIKKTTSFLRDWSNNYKNIIYSEYLAFLNSLVSNVDSVNVVEKYNKGIYKKRYIKPKEAVFTEVRVFNEEDLSGVHQIGSDGAVRLPLVGRMVVRGMSPEEATDKITAAFNKEYLQNAQITVFVKEFNSRKIYVLGQVKKPGPYPFEEQMTLIAAIARAGGTTRLADPNRTVVTRETDGNKRRFQAMVGDIGQGRATDVSLRPGDIVFVPESLF